MPAVSFTDVTNDSDDHRGARTADFVGVVGKVLITLGLLLLAFVVYQLWGTSFEESRAQSDLAKSFSSQVAATDTTLPDTTTDTTPNTNDSRPDTTASYPEQAIRGKAIGRITIPKIDVNKWIVAGVDWNSLKKGPGVYLDGPLPGQKGNSSIAGHRTTFGAPFERVDELKEGDVITIETRQGTFGYVVTWTKIVRPDDLSVLEPDPSVESSITLISCTPKFSSSKRIIIRANIAPDNPTPVKPATPLIDSVDPTDAESLTSQPLSAGWMHDTGGVVPALILGVLLLIIWRIPRLTRRRLSTFPARLGVVAVSILLFLPTLFFFFQNVSKLVPTNL